MRYLVFLFFFFLLRPIHGQVETKHESRNDANFNMFPDKCLGVWEGQMYIYVQNALRDSVAVRFTAAASDSVGVYIWKTEYLSENEPIIKDYKLRVDDLSKGRYLLDEGNGIGIIEFNYGDKLYSAFQTENIYLTSTTELRGEKLIFEVSSGRIINPDDEVISYSFDHLQRVELTRTQTR